MQLITLVYCRCSHCTQTGYRHLQLLQPARLTCHCSQPAHTGPCSYCRQLGNTACTVTWNYCSQPGKTAPAVTAASLKTLQVRGQYSMKSEEKRFPWIKQLWRENLNLAPTIQNIQPCTQPGNNTYNFLICIVTIFKKISHQLTLTIWNLTLAEISCGCLTNPSPK